jgi:CheY-like chemotaxis protein
MAHKLLLADDSITIQKVVSLTFAEEDFEVTCVGNGEIAIEKIREARPDIVLADIFMPRKTGYEVCEFVKTTPQYQHIPVILLVGTFEPFDKNEAARVRSDGYLTKPFETTALVKLVRQTLAKAGPAPDLDKTFQVPSEDLKRRLEQTTTPEPGTGPLPPTPAARPQGPEDFEMTVVSPVAAPKSGLGPDEVLLTSEEEVVVPASPEPPPAHSAPTVTIPSAEVAPASEPAFESIPTTPPADDQLLEMPVIVRKIRIPSEEDILGVFELINLDGIIARQQSLEQAVRQEAAAQQAPVITAPEHEMEAGASAVEQDAEIFEEMAAPAPPRPAPAYAPPAPAEAPAAAGETVLDTDTVTRIARLVVEKLSEKVIREIAWEVVPDLAETLLRQEIGKRKADGKL